MENNCERCGQNCDAGHTMSYFNTDKLCDACMKEERAHPDFKAAQDADVAAIKKGYYNFPGIGLPDDLKAKYNKE